MNMKFKAIWVRMFWMAAAVTAFNAPLLAKVTVNEGNGVNITMENDALKLNIAVEAGGRISSLINKKTGHELIPLWKGLDTIGGLLDDRNVFTSLAYRAQVTQPGGEIGQVRLRANHSGGLSMVKTLTLREGSSTLEVSETLSNGTQQSTRFMLRSFLMPGGGPLSEADHYFIPAKGKPLQPAARPNGYFGDPAAPWSALWNSANGEGILVAAPGVEQFYFWQGSKINPTYEWTYPNVPAGQSLSVQFALHVINDKSPDWKTLSTATLKGLRNARPAAVAGWLNERQRYRITPAEESLGYWLSTGDGDGKRRLPQPLRIDAPLNQSRSVYIALNALKALPKGELKIQLENVPAGLVQTGWQTSGKDFIKVVPFSPSTTVNLPDGTEGRLWLTLKGGNKPVDANGTLVISLNGQVMRLPLEAKVWPVNVPKIRPFDVRGYGGFVTMVGGYTITPETIKQMDQTLDAYQAIGGNVFDWALNWPLMYRQLKIAGTDQTIATWIKKNRKEFSEKPPAEWPRIDFSYYQPWIEATKARGITRVTATLPLPTETKPISAEQEWILIQLKSYLEPQGFHGFYCKIADEMSPESIPAYSQAAAIVQRLGWRPTTTVTGLIARTASDINRLNPFCDVWVLNRALTQFFDEAIHQSYRLEPRTVELPKQWGKYGNGGAQNTIAQRLFNGPIAAPANEVENVQVLQDGKPLKLAGGSPWGNRKQGVFFPMMNDYLYLSPLPGTDANKSNFTVKYQARVPAPTSKPLAKIDPTDEVWFYGGAAHCYVVPYEGAATYPLKALNGGYFGYAWYAFYRYNDDKVLWYDSKAQTLDIGPAYLGLKDGWDDACLMFWLNKEKKAPVAQFMSDNPGAPLRVGTVEREAYHWKGVVNLTDPFVLNDARRKMLEVAAQ
jgi:hypothetical protein